MITDVLIHFGLEATGALGVPAAWGGPFAGGAHACGR